MNDYEQQCAVLSILRRWWNVESDSEADRRDKAVQDILKLFKEEE